MVEAHECAPTGSHQDFGSAKTPVGQIDAEVEAVELERFADAEAAEAENHLRRGNLIHLISKVNNFLKRRIEFLKVTKVFFLISSKSIKTLSAVHIDLLI